MNYGQIVDQIRDLGFADDNEIEEFGAVVPNAINRAITEISLNYAPHLDYMEIVQPFETVTVEDGGGKHTKKLEPSGGEWNDAAYYEYVMPDDFLKFDKIPIKRQLGEGIYQRFNDFEVEDDNTLIIKGEYEGTFRVYYVADHEPFSEDTVREAEIPLPLKAHHLIPLLAGYYIWLDDDQAKAMEYYSKYQQESASAIAESVKPRGRILADRGV